MDDPRKDDLEEEMSRFEQEIAGQLPPPPKPPVLPTLPSSGLPGPQMVPPLLPPPQLGTFVPPLGAPPPPPVSANLPTFQPLAPPSMPSFMPGQPLGLGSVSNSTSFGNSQGTAPMQLPIPHPLIPPPIPPIVPILPALSIPTIKPPTVPLDNYDPTEDSEVSREGGSSKSEKDKDKKKEKKKKFVRVGGGTVWEDESLTDWDPNDFRIFCGDLGNEVTDEYLWRAFQKYPSVQKAKVIRDKKSKKTKGYGFVSFKDPQDYLKAMREMNGKYIGNRPIKLRKSTWKDRNIDVARKKEKEKKKLGLR